MYSLLLIIIYIAFISLGLPDSLIGSGWPAMHLDLEVPVSFAGIVSMVIAGGTILSSLFSDKLTKRFGAGKVTAVSVLTTAVALFGFSMSSHFWILIVWAIPYGLGAGAVDAALNNYVALNYASRHMSWLHAFWGVGAAISPYIMSYYLTNGQSWQLGYQTVGIIQIILTIVLFASLPLWKQRKRYDTTVDSIQEVELSFFDIIQFRGIALIMIAFFSYQAVEQTAGLWASTYLVNAKGVDVDIAARFASYFYLGITAGRFASGFIADYFGDRQLIRWGTVITFIGVVLMMLPFETTTLTLIGLVIIGLGCAPIYPSIIHATPDNFGKENSQAVIGIQMAAAYVGTTIMPPLFGFLTSWLGIWIYPFFIAFFIVAMFLSTERLNKVIGPFETE